MGFVLSWPIELTCCADFFTKNIDRTWRLLENLEAGMIGMNTGNSSAAESPFGGIKESGYGKESGKDVAVQEYMITKTVGSLVDAALNLADCPYRARSRWPTTTRPLFGVCDRMLDVRNVLCDLYLIRVHISFEDVTCCSPAIWKLSSALHVPRVPPPHAEPHKSLSTSCFHHPPTRGTASQESNLHCNLDRVLRQTKGC